MERKLRAIYGKDFSNILNFLGMLESVENGQRFCVVCATPLTVDTIGALVPEESNDNPKESNVSFVCVECVHRIDQDVFALD